MNDQRISIPTAPRAARRALPTLLVLWLGLALSPTWATISVIGGLSRESVSKPGARSEGRVILRNNGTVPQAVRIYQTDYRFWADGRNDYAEPGTQPRSNAKWLTVTPNQVTVAAGGIESIYYTLNVPNNDKLSGTYGSVLMVEPLAATALEPPTPLQGAAKVGIQTVMRYAIQMVTHIGDTGTRSLKFIDKQLVFSPERRRILSLDAENTGERWLQPVLWAELYDAKGLLVGRFDASKFRIYNGCSVRYKLDLTDVPAGHYKALVVADNGDDHVFGAQYELDLT